MQSLFIIKHMIALKSGQGCG